MAATVRGEVVLVRHRRRFLVVIALAVAAGSAAAASALASDLVILRDGSRRAGRLMGCVGARCAFDAGLVARNEIEWIGFGVAASASPPAPNQNSEDEVHLVSGAIEVTAVHGISLAAVLTNAGLIVRETARWVRFAVKVAPSGPAQGPGTHADPPPPRAPRSANDPVRACPDDEPLGGFVELDQSYSTSSFRCHGKAKLWFDLVANPQIPWPAVLAQQFHAKTIVYELSSRGCFDIPDPGGGVCTAPERQIDGRYEFSVGPYGVENYPSSISFQPTGPEIEFSTLPDEISRGLTVPLTCVDPAGQSTGDWIYAVGGGVFPFSMGGCTESGRNFACVAATVCEGSERTDCILHPDRYAVLPFRGRESWSLSWPDGRAESHAYFWDVCCGCGEPGRDSRR